MNSIAIGEQLKNAREARGLSIDYVAEETNIAKRYIEAMEEENFSVFPGDPYIIGFLRNYADYLGIDSTAIVQAFRGIRIQEQPVPIDELLSPKKLPIWPFILVAVLLVLGGSGFFVYKKFIEKPAIDETIIAKHEPVQYSLETQKFEKRLYEGDSIVIPYKNDNYKIEISSIDDKISIKTPIGISRYMLGEEGTIDLDKDNKPEITAFIADFQKGKAETGVSIRFTAMMELANTLPNGKEQEKDAVIEASQIAVPASIMPDRPTTQDSTIFTGKRSPYPFVLNVTFRSYAMFRHEIDRKDRSERYYHKGDQITVTANNYAKIWTSNAAACKITIQASGGQSVDVDLGNPGMVAVKQIRWSQGDDKLWNLGFYDVN